MMRTVALDDEIPALQILTAFCNKLDFIHLQHVFDRPSEALRYLQEHPVDLLLLDIRLPEVSGLELHRALGAHTAVIYTTAYPDYAVESYALDAVDYLLKPFAFDRFEQAVRKAWRYFQCRTLLVTGAQHVFLRTGHELHQVLLADIQYVQAVDDYLNIYRQNARPLLVRMTLKALLAQLPSTDFAQVHRSYVVPFRRITGLRTRMVVLDQIALPIGPTYEVRFLEQFEQHRLRIAASGLGLTPR